MSQEEFIAAIRVAVVESSYKSLESNLIDPPGRQPDSKLLDFANWFNSLNEINKSKLLGVIRETVETTVFSFLCVLDGVRAIENGKDKGKLSLYYEKNGNKDLLNNPDDDYLHELL